MRSERFRDFLEKQKKEIEEWKWQEGLRLGCDPGEESVKEWIQKYAKIYRKNFVLSDFKNSLLELKTIRDNIQGHITKIGDLLKIVNECEEKILDGIEMYEAEPD